LSEYGTRSAPRARAIAQATQKLVAARDRWLKPARVGGFRARDRGRISRSLMPKDEAATATLRKRTLTALYNQRGKPESAWLDALHRALMKPWPPPMAGRQLSLTMTWQPAVPGLCSGRCTTARSSAVVALDDSAEGCCQKGSALTSARQ
jgi:hypothetical protein